MVSFSVAIVEQVSLPVCNCHELPRFIFKSILVVFLLGRERATATKELSVATNATAAAYQNVSYVMGILLSFFSAEMGFTKVRSPLT